MISNAMTKMGLQRSPHAFSESPERTVSMDPVDEFPGGKLRFCIRLIARRKIGKDRNSQAAGRGSRTHL